MTDDKRPTVSMMVRSAIGAPLTAAVLFAGMAGLGVEPVVAARVAAGILLALAVVWTALGLLLLLVGALFVSWVDAVDRASR